MAGSWAGAGVPRDLRRGGFQRRGPDLQGAFGLLADLPEVSAGSDLRLLAASLWVVSRGGVHCRRCWREQGGGLEQAAKLFLADLMVGAFAGLEVLHHFISDFEALEIDDADEFVPAPRALLHPVSGRPCASNERVAWRGGVWA